MADWKARFAAAEMLPDLEPMQEGFTLPEGVNVAELRKLYCVTLATSDTECDERIDRLMHYTDPAMVLSIVAPYVPVTYIDPTPPPPVVVPDEPEETLGETVAHEPVKGHGVTFEDKGITTEVTYETRWED